jgi:porin
MAFNFNPLIAFTVPYSTLGLGAVVLPTKDPQEAIVSLLVLSANDSPSTSGFGDLNGNKLTLAAEGRVRTDFFGLTGHQDFGTSFSNKKFTSIDQRLDRDTIQNGTLRAERSWNIWYNFDQYLYEPKRGGPRRRCLRRGGCRRQSQFHEILWQLRCRRQGMFESRPLTSSA